MSIFVLFQRCSGAISQTGAAPKRIQKQGRIPPSVYIVAFIYPLDSLPPLSPPPTSLCHSTSTVAYFLQIHFLIGAAARRCCCSAAAARRSPKKKGAAWGNGLTLKTTVHPENGLRCTRKAHRWQMTRLHKLQHWQFILTEMLLFFLFCFVFSGWIWNC